MAVTRTPESKIKQAILHPVEEIRETAISYFSKARCDDESIMPLVIQAVEKYGRETGFRILCDAEPLPQTDATINWVIEELRRNYDLTDVNQENYCFVLAAILHRAPQPLIWKRCNDIMAAPAVLEQFIQPIQDHLERFSWDWDQGWTALKYWAEDTMRRGDLTRSDIGWARGIVESMARHRTEKAKVLAWLRGEYGDEDHNMMKWLRPRFMDIAGEMRLNEAVPLLVRWLGDEDLYLSEGAGEALERIGGDLVVRAIGARWRRADAEFRCSAACRLGYVRGDLCIERCLDFFECEEDHGTKLALADALLGNFAEEGIDPVWMFLADIDDESDWDARDLRYRLVAVCEIIGRTFPFFDEWHAAALRDDWGRFGMAPYRLANMFGPEWFGPRWSEN